ncbi:MAG: mandelate racemase/muconate lactonizing enzyme family protein [Halobacteriaceae archaeon]
MEITGVDQHHLVYELDGTWEPSWVPGATTHTHELDLFALQTDADITGYTAVPSFPGGGLDLAAGYESVLRGEDPREIEAVLEKLETIDFLGADAWHLEVALWDILGKSVGEPVWRLLGGSPDPIPVYASTGERQAAEDRLAYVEDRVSEGFTGVKLRFGAEDPEDDLYVARYVREEFPQLTLMVDANMGWTMRLADADPVRWTPKQAQSIAHALEDLAPVAWLEEPLPMHDYDRLAELRAATDIPIAGGESVNGVTPLREYIRHDSLDILQPDAVFATGIRRAKTIGDLAAVHGLGFAPHTWSNGVGLAANLHVMAATDTRWCEYPLEPPAWDAPARDFLLADPLTPTDGAIAAPSGPGLGVELDWTAIETAEQPL